MLSHKIMTTSGDAAACEAGDSLKMTDDREDMNEMERLVAEEETDESINLDNSLAGARTRHNGHQCLLFGVSLLLFVIHLYHGRGTSSHVATTTRRESSQGEFQDLTAASEPTPFTKVMTGMTRVHANDGKVYKVSERTALQIENYRQGTGLILNLHITHHGGTTVCREIGYSPDAKGRAPEKACNTEPDMEETTGYAYREVPWRGKEETAQMIPIVRKHFHMVGWEFGYYGRLPKRPLSEVDWENPNLLSVLVMRDPISRLLAGSGFVHQNYPSIDKGHGTYEDWWGYANNTWFTNNYALRVLAGNGCCKGAETERRHLKHAKALVKRFSIVLDIACLDAGVEAIANLGNITLASAGKKQSGGSAAKIHHHAPSRERIGYDDVYEYLLEKNKLDIELYEWSKSIALIDCSKL